MPRNGKGAKIPGPPAAGGYQGAGNPGGGAQPMTAPTGLPYGEHKALVDSQQAIPLPGGGASTPSSPAPGGAVPGGPPSGTAAGPPVSSGNPMADALQAALGASPPSGGMLADTSRPGEPITHGLASGPGGGPEVLAPAGPSLADKMDRIAAVNGDPQLARLAQLARTLAGPNA